MWKGESIILKLATFKPFLKVIFNVLKFYKILLLKKIIIFYLFIFSTNILSRTIYEISSCLPSACGHLGSAWGEESRRGTRALRFGTRVLGERVRAASSALRRNRERSTSPSGRVSCHAARLFSRECHNKRGINLTPAYSFIHAHPHRLPESHVTWLYLRPRSIIWPKKIDFAFLA